MSEDLIDVAISRLLETVQEKRQEPGREMIGIAFDDDADDTLVLELEADANGRIPPVRPKPEGGAVSALWRYERYPEMVELSARQRAPQHIVHYLRELAQEFHTYYNAHRFIADDAALRHVEERDLVGRAQQDGAEE